MMIIQRLQTLAFALYNSILNLNIYITTDEDSTETRRNHIQSTRVFLVLISLSMVILTGYTMLSERTYTVNVQNLSQSEYERLQAIYPNTLTCPCSKISIPLGSFINISVTFHQV